MIEWHEVTTSIFYGDNWQIVKCDKNYLIYADYGLRYKHTAKSEHEAQEWINDYLKGYNAGNS